MHIFQSKTVAMHQVFWVATWDWLQIPIDVHAKMQK